ncbi:MAG: hypothetical protein AAF622_17585, partial [Cyanobacteria bacterium P01_C01_bin.147]
TAKLIKISRTKLLPQLQIATLTSLPRFELHLSLKHWIKGSALRMQHLAIQPGLDRNFSHLHDCS